MAHISPWFVQSEIQFPDSGSGDIVLKFCTLPYSFLLTLLIAVSTLRLTG